MPQVGNTLTVAVPHPRSLITHKHEHSSNLIWIDQTYLHAGHDVHVLHRYFESIRDVLRLVIHLSSPQPSVHEAREGLCVRLGVTKRQDTLTQNHAEQDEQGKVVSVRCVLDSHTRHIRHNGENVSAVRQLKDMVPPTEEEQEPAQAVDRGGEER